MTPTFYDWASLVLGQEGPWTITMLRPGEQSRLVRCDDILAADVAVRSAMLADPDRHMWIDLGRRRPGLAPGKRGGIEDVVSVNALWSDIDVAHPDAHKSTGALWPSKEEAMRFLDELPLAPSCVVDTGYGLQPYWALAEPLEGESMSLIGRWGRWVDRRSREWGYEADTAVLQPAAMLRIPGTFNVKVPSSPREVRVVVWAPHRLYGPDHFDFIPSIDEEIRQVRTLGIDPGGPALIGESPGDHFGRTVLAENVLTEVGYFVLDRQPNDGLHVHLGRPGKDRATITGPSISVNQTTNRAYVFSSSIPELESGRSYGPFSLYARLYHRGDPVLAAAELRRKGYGGSGQRIELNSGPSRAHSGQAGPEPEPGEEDLDADLDPIDLGPWLDGTIEQQRPEVGRVAGSMDGLLYRGQINSLHGDSGSGKTWAALVVAVQEIQAGRNVVWVHLEDPTPAQVIARLHLLGLTPAQIAGQFRYVSPELPISDRVRAKRIGRHIGPGDLVVVDSLGEALALSGIDENKDVEVSGWFKRFARSLTDVHEATVLLIDHATKAADNPLHPSGSKRKRAAVTGAVYLVESPGGLDADTGGTITLKVAKDRGGVRRRGVTAAELTLKPGPLGTRWDLAAPGPEESDPRPDTHPTSLIARIVDAVGRLEGNPGEGISVRALRSAGIGIRTSELGGLVDLAVAQGSLVRVARPAGMGGRTVEWITVAPDYGDIY